MTINLFKRLTKIGTVFTFIILLISIPFFLEATDLRGKVKNKNNNVISSIKVVLWQKNAKNGKWEKIRETRTGQDGMYYMFDIKSGNYIVQVGGKNYPILVENKKQQDLPVIVVNSRLKASIR